MGLAHKVQLHRDLKDQGLRILTVNIEEEERHEAAKSILEKHQITLSNVALKQAEAESALGVLEAVDRDLPAINIYGRQGKLRFTSTGLDEEELEGQVAMLLAEQP